MIERKNKMNNIEIIFIVFGSSATIVVILIFIFKWLSIGNKKYKGINKVSKKSELYKKSNDFAMSGSLYSINKSNSSIWKNLSHTTEILDFSDISVTDLNTESLITHSKPILKYTIPCMTEFTLSKSLNNLNLPSNCAKLEVEINYNPFEECLEVKVIQAKELYPIFLKLFQSDNEILFNEKFNSNQVISNYLPEFYQVYLIIWLNDDFSEHLKSRVNIFGNTIEFNDDFKWLVEDSFLMLAKVNILMYIKNLKTGIESAFLQTSLRIGEVYMYHPTRTWLSLNDLDQKWNYLGEILISLSYLPTAERLTAIIVEARNLQFQSNTFLGDTFVKISLVRQNGSEIETYKTSVRTNDPNPQFNEATIFKVSTKDFNKIFLKLCIYEIINNQEFLIGNVFIGPKNDDSSNSHWQHMLKQVRRQVTIWHPILNS